MNNSISVRESKKHLLISVISEVPADEIVLKIYSERNAPLKKNSDISLHAPSQAQIQKKTCSGEIYFPVIDFSLDARFYAEFIFSDCKQCGFYINGYLWKNRECCSAQVILPGYKLQEWENILFIEEKEVELHSFALIVHCPCLGTLNQKTDISLKLLESNWNGKVDAYYVAGGKSGLIGNVLVTSEKIKRENRGRSALDYCTILDALKLSIKNLYSNKNECIHSPLYQGMYLFYDLDARTNRQSAWLWGWGPAINALLMARSIKEITSEMPENLLLQRAYEAGIVTLKGIYTQDDSSLDQLSTARWDPNPWMPRGIRERINIAADSGFLCGWAWCPLFIATGDRRFLEAASNYIEKTNAYVNKYGIPPQDYCPEKQKLSPYTLDESGFGTEAYAAFYRITNDPTIKEYGKQYTLVHLKKFERPDGLWERAYYPAEDRVEQSIHMTRGLGWAMEGLLATYELTDDQLFLEKAEKMANHMIQSQSKEGCWSFVFDQPIELSGYDDKGTPLWSYLLYRLYRYTKRSHHLSSARKALKYCIEHQIILGEDSCVGTLPAANPHSGIVYRPWFEMSCLYATGFLALALIEEYNLIQKNR